MAFPVPLDGADALLIVADSERNCDLFWATQFRAPDPFIYIATQETACVVVKDLELDRAREQVCDADVVASSEYEKRLGENPAAGAVLAELLRDRGLRRLLVPEEFPVGIADRLRAGGFELSVAQGPLFPARAVKSAAEIEAIAGAQVAAEAGMQTAADALRGATIDGDQLMLDGVQLTAEEVRRRIHHTLLEHGCHAHHTIVAGGEQGVDPHQSGHGPLAAHQLIVIDIFPQHTTSGYYGDITRTFVRGTISPDMQRLYDTVAEAQAVALGTIRAGVDGHAVHAGVANHFAEAGYDTGDRDGRMQGFFHGTGHGVGLEIHEAPSLSKRTCMLQTDHVVTVEPGLYYAGLGGARIEDLVVVEESGYRNLTTFPKDLGL
jgi:Xaa-Pro aminopeptidase